MITSKLFIGNLPLGIQEQDMKGLLREHGDIIDVKVVANDSVSFAFATMVCDSDAVIKRFNRTMYRGQQIAASRAKPERVETVTIDSA